MKEYIGIQKSINPQLNILTIGCELFSRKIYLNLNDGYFKADYIISDIDEK